MGKGRKEGRIQRPVDIYLGGNLSLAEFTARTSLIGVILGRTTPPSISPSIHPPPFSTSGPDPLISPHPFTPLSSVSSCTKPSVIPSATETVTGLRIRSAPCPRNSNHYDAHVNSNRRANTEAARTTREISTPNPSSFYPLPPLPPPPPLDYTEYSFNPLVQFSIGEQINRREGRIGEGRGWLLWIARL